MATNSSNVFNISTSLNHFTSSLFDFFSKKNDGINKIPNEIIVGLFSDFDQFNKASLGRTCKRFHAIYLNNSPKALCSHELFTALKNPIKELTAATLQQAPLKAGLKEQAFQRLFSIFLQKLNGMEIKAGDDRYGFCLKFVIQMIESSFKEAAPITTNFFTALKKDDPQLAKVDGIVNSLNTCVFYNICSSFAKQSIDKITIKGFKEIIVILRSYYPHNETSSLETPLRQAINRAHASQEFGSIRQEYLNPAEDMPHFVAVKAALEKELIEQRTAHLKEFPDCQLNANEGTVGAALQAIEQALTERDQALSSFVGTFGFSSLILKAKYPTDAGKTMIGCHDAAVVREMIAATNNEEATSQQSDITAVKELLKEYQQKERVYQEKVNIYASCKLREIEKKLQPASLVIATRAEMIKIASFYDELKQVVADNNARVRWQAIHRIID